MGSDWLGIVQHGRLVPDGRAYWPLGIERPALFVCEACGRWFVEEVRRSPEQDAVRRWIEHLCAEAA